MSSGVGLLNLAQQQRQPSLLELAQRLAHGQIAQGLLSGATLPGDVYSGHQQLWDSGGDIAPQAVQRSLDTAGMATLGAGAMPSPQGALRAGISPRAIMPDGSVDLGWVMKDVARMPNDKATNRLRSQLNDAGNYTEAELPIRALNATQDKVNADFAAPRSPKGDGSDLPAVYKMDGQYYVMDGHHRITAAAKNSDTAKVRLFDMDAARGIGLPDPSQMDLYK